jgi:hypothetical protein
MTQLPISIKDPVKRYEICKGCEKFFAPTRQCAECMCTMNAKVKLPEATCPLKKW